MFEHAVAPAPRSVPPTAAREAIARNPVWYHVIEVAPGVQTPGVIDHRAVAPLILPADLSGRRALDVGTFDGFWALELERRGAEVVAIDLPSFQAVELPPLNRDRLEKEAAATDLELGRGFRIVSSLLGSTARYVQSSVYDLSPETVGGSVDFVFVGDLLLHLRDPVRALERIAGVLAPHGRLLVLEPFSLPLTLRAPLRPTGHFQCLETPFNWWVPSLAGLNGWLRAAGFGDVRPRGFHRPRARQDMLMWHVALEASPGWTAGEGNGRRLARVARTLAAFGRAPLTRA